MLASDFTSAYGGEKYGSWNDEASPRFLTGCAKYNIGASASLDAWTSPSYDVPSALLTITQNDGGDTFCIDADLVARGSTPIGSDPQMLEAYYSDLAWLDKAYAIEGSSPLPPLESFNRRILTSPFRLGLSNLSFEDVERLSSDHIDRFLGFLSAAQPIPARLRGSFNARDDKLRQYFFRGELERYTKAYGEEEGKVLAAVSTGPISEAYVGGGS